MAIWKRHRGENKSKSRNKKATDAGVVEGTNVAVYPREISTIDEEYRAADEKYFRPNLLRAGFSWEKARQSFKKAWDEVEGRNSYISYITYISFLSSSILFCIGHGLALVTPKDKLCDLKRQITLLALAMLIASYCFAIVLSSTPSLCKKNTRDEFKKIASVEYITSMSEAIFSLALACVATKFMVEKTREPFFLLIGYCMCSLFSIASSVATICKITGMPKGKRPDNYQVRIAMRFLSILLSTTNICMCLAGIFGPKIDAPDHLRTSVKLAVNIGWVVVFSGAIVLLRAGQLKLEGAGRVTQDVPQDRVALKAMLIKDMQCSPGIDVSVGGLAIAEHIG